MKQEEVVQLKTEELNERIEDHEELLTKMKINDAVSKLENPISIRVTRKSVARLKTELRKRQIEETNK